jgi:hypothetical protein
MVGGASSTAVANSQSLRRHFPQHLTADLLPRMIANRIQEEAFGTLNRAALKLLDGLARRNSPAERNLKIGTVLVRRSSTGALACDTARRAAPSLAWAGASSFATVARGEPLRVRDRGRNASNNCLVLADGPAHGSRCRPRLRSAPAHAAAFQGDGLGGTLNRP